MGSSISNDKVQPSEVNKFKDFQKSESEDSEKCKAKSRTSTDVCFLIVFIVFLTALICFLAYCVFNGDIFRTINGYDDCGNICGRNNKNLKHLDNKSNASQCLGTSKVNEPYHIVLRQSSSKEFNRLCISDCSLYEGYRKFFNRCMPNKSQTVVNTIFSRTGLSNFFTEVSEDFQICWTEICYLCLIALVLSSLLLVLFRYLVGVVVWIVLLGSLAACLIGTILLWCVNTLQGPQYGALWYPFFNFFRILWKHSKDANDGMPSSLLPDVDVRKSDTYLVFAILATIVTVIISLIIFVMRNRIKLVVQLFEEAGKAIAAMPILLLEPILTFIFLGVTIALWFYFCLWIESSGTLTETRANVFYYKKDGWMKFTRWYNFFGMLWMAQFIIGCQHMVIAGAVSIWYFKRNKASLGTPFL
ncbi:unnamed protein product [Diabrotica balteata]|uniref:Choline transporter-like protein n=1 Tax=Diabrotica balteata TaxID=107213 RepID=A0A9N9TBX2_DIABA|nr:unnamed protein product [Diabrotica balteata]